MTTAQQRTLYPSAARTATPTAVQFNTGDHRGVRVVIDCTAVTATPSVVPTLDYLDDLSSKWTTLLTGAAVTATGTVALTIYPGITAAANVSAAMIVSGTMRLVMTHGDADSITYTAGLHLLP